MISTSARQEKTAVEHIGATMERVVKEASEPGLSTVELLELKKQATKTVLGSEIINYSVFDNLVEQAKSKKRSEVEAYQKTCNEITADFLANGLPKPIFVPREGWERICKKANFFTCRIDADEIKVSGKPLEQMTENADSLKKAFGWLVWGAIAYFLTMAVSMYFPADASSANIIGAWIASALLSGIISGLVVAVLDVLHVFDVLRAGLIRAQIIAFSMLPKSFVLRKLMPEHKTVDKEPALTAKIRIPKPPREKWENILKLGYVSGVHVALVPGAIHFVGGFHRVLLKKHVEEHRQYLLRKDPIVFTKKGNVVAISEQWGDFPVEKRAIEEALRNPNVFNAA